MEATALSAATVGALAELLAGRSVAVLTGAGCSTESGIPDYRGPETRRRARNPVQYRAFVTDAQARTRYWARSVLGWARFRSARPNAAHAALAELERAGIVTGLITQNVDRLHHRAGSRRVVELHGALAEVRCLACGAIEPRDALQDRLLAANPGWLDRQAEMAPDGDAELTSEQIAGFRVVACRACDGVLKPNVVFFGEAVPPAVVEDAYALVERASALLVVGSSLAVFSGYRFVRAAAKRPIPIAIVNLGECRGDPHASLVVEGRAGEVLPALARALGASDASAQPSDGAHDA